MIELIGTITEQTAIDVEEQLSNIVGPVDAFIDSSGGDLFAGLKIYDMFSDRDMNIKVKRAGSVASIIALAGKNKPTVSSKGGFAIHNAHVENTKGNHHDLRATADSLEKYSQIVARIYQQKTKLSNAQAVSLMNDSTTINARDAVALGFASAINEDELVHNHKEIISNIINIDMSLLKTVMNNLGLADPATPPTEVTPTVPANAETVEAPTEEAAFSEAQVAQITELVTALIAEALPDNVPTEEEIGNTIAVVLNQVVSKGAPPVNPTIVNNMQPETTAMDGFNKTMKDIKDKANGLDK